MGGGNFCLGQMSALRQICDHACMGVRLEETRPRACVLRHGFDIIHAHGHTEYSTLHVSLPPLSSTRPCLTPMHQCDFGTHQELQKCVEGIDNRSLLLGNRHRCGHVQLGGVHEVSDAGRACAGNGHRYDCNPIRSQRKQSKNTQKKKT